MQLTHSSRTKSRSAESRAAWITRVVVVEAVLSYSKGRDVPQSRKAVHTRVACLAPPLPTNLVEHFGRRVPDVHQPRVQRQRQEDGAEQQIGPAPPGPRGSGRGDGSLVNLIGGGVRGRLRRAGTPLAQGRRSAQRRALHDRESARTRVHAHTRCSAGGT